MFPNKGLGNVPKYLVPRPPNVLTEKEVMEKNADYKDWLNSLTPAQRDNLKPIPRDPVNHPSHYKLNEHGIECIDAIEASMSKEEFQGYLKGNVLKYLWRYKYKGKPVEDLQKANTYLNMLIKKV